MERRELTALARVLTVQVRESIAAELRGLKDQLQEVKVYVDQRIRDITPPLQVKGEPGKDADPVDYHIIGAQIQAEVDKRIESALKAAVAEIPIINGVDGRDADPELVRSMVESQVRDAVAAIPPPKDGQPGKDVDQEVLYRMVVDEVARTVEALPSPKDGIDGKDATPVDTSLIVAEVLRQIPTPQDGKDGESVDPEIIKEMVIAEATRAVAAIPAPKDGVDGKDAPAVDVEALIAEVVKRIPPPKDGRDVDQEAVKLFVVEQVRQAVAALPTPKDGKDAEPIHPDTISLMVMQEVTRAIEALPKPKDGKDGTDGRSALSMDILPTIDPMKSYPRGTEALYRGGTIKAVRTTDPVGDGSLEQSGWSIVADGVADWRVVQKEDDPRVLVSEAVRTSGKTEVLQVYIPMPLHQGVWREGGEYKKGDTVQRDGSQWLCLRDCAKTQPGIKDSDWRLMVKRGADGKTGPPGKSGENGKDGRPGRDLTQMDNSGKKW